MYENYDLTNIQTPVNVQEFEFLLQKYEYDLAKSEFLVNGFSHGFNIGYQGRRDIQLNAPNLKFTVGDEIELWNKIMGEVKLKRYAGPFKAPPFKNYIQSPIGLVPKDQGKKTRLIFHLSYPRRPKEKVQLSVNGNTPACLTKVKYMDFDQAVLLCIQAGRGCFGGKSDMSAAFRNLAIRILDWMLLVMKAKNPITGETCYFVDKCLPFGAAISCALFQAFSDAVAFIVSKKTGKKLVNYLDDFFFVALLKMLCNSQITEFLQTCDTINFPVSLEKTFWANTQIVFLGLLINTRTCTVSIPIEKVKKALKLVSYFLCKKKATLTEIQQLCGTLNFICKAVVPGRAFMRRLYDVTRGVTNPGHHVKLVKSFKGDLRLWQTFLLQPEVYSRPFMDFESMLKARNISFYTDASRNATLGCGGINEAEWFIFPWCTSTLLEINPSIAYLELYAATIGLHLWLHKYKNSRIVIFCDNMSVVHMLNSQTSHCKRCMTLIRLIVLQQLLHNTRVFAKHVPTENNILSDALSRGQMNRFYAEIRNQNRRINSTPSPVPNNLSDMRYLWYESSN